MKAFFRIFQYSEKIPKRLILFFLFSVIGTILGAVSLAVAIPLLDVLFEKVDVSSIPPLPAFELSAVYFKGAFNHYFSSIILEQGKTAALLFICIVIVSGKFL